MKAKKLFDKSAHANGLKVHIRWMIRRDMPEVLEIEGQSFGDPWTEENFIHCLRQRNCIGMVAEYDGRVVAFMIYELNKVELHVLNLAVQKQVRRRGVGFQLADKLIGKLTAKRRNRIIMRISEKNLAGQMFFKRCGFRAISVIRDYFTNSDDAYVFRYGLEKATQPLERPNRMFDSKVGPDSRNG